MSAVMGDSRYELLSLLGKGGFGSVFLGRMVAGDLTRSVAIKVLHRNVSDDFEVRLRDEARIMAKLQHNSFVQVFDLIRINERSAVVMEYVPGADLLTLLKKKPLPPRVVAEIVRDVAEALHIVHHANDPATGQPLSIIHRDIKPANVQITPTGGVKLLDFGIARASFDQREAHTQQEWFGSRGYIAPERYEFKETPAIDLYALGVVMYEALAGHRFPKLGISRLEHDKKREEAIAELSIVAKPLSPLIRELMSYDAERRPTAQTVARFLQDNLAGLDGPWMSDWAGSEVPKLIIDEGSVPSAQVKSMEKEQESEAPTTVQDSLSEAFGLDTTSLVVGVTGALALSTLLAAMMILGGILLLV